MDGVPFRKLADLYGISQGKAFSQVESEMDQLAENTYLSKTFCSSWSGILNLDGKYVKVKGFSKKIPFVYGLEFYYQWHKSCLEKYRYRSCHWELLPV